MLEVFSGNGTDMARSFNYFPIEKNSFMFILGFSKKKKKNAKFSTYKINI